MLSGPMANGLEDEALRVPASTLPGGGDAICTTEITSWSLPVEQGSLGTGVPGGAGGIARVPARARVPRSALGPRRASSWSCAPSGERASPPCPGMPGVARRRPGTRRR